MEPRICVPKCSYPSTLVVNGCKLCSRDYSMLLAKCVSVEVLCVHGGVDWVMMFFSHVDRGFFLFSLTTLSCSCSFTETECFEELRTVSVQDIYLQKDSYRYFVCIMDIHQCNFLPKSYWCEVVSPTFFP